MELEKQVCSLESAKKLKELSVKQESLFYWNRVRYLSGIDNPTKQEIKDKKLIAIKSHFKIDEGKDLWCYEGWKIERNNREIPHLWEAGIVGALNCCGNTKENISNALSKELENSKKELSYSAFTVAELGEILPKTFKASKDITFPKEIQRKEDVVEWNLEMRNGGLEVVYIWYYHEAMDYLTIKGDTEAEARAKMLIYLLENKLI